MESESERKREREEVRDAKCLALNLPLIVPYAKRHPATQPTSPSPDPHEQPQMRQLNCTDRELKSIAYFPAPIEQPSPYHSSSRLANKLHQTMAKYFRQASPNDAHRLTTFLLATQVYFYCCSYFCCCCYLRFFLVIVGAWSLEC